MHTDVTSDQIGKYVFLPGSVERAALIAEHFDNPVKVAHKREFLTYTGTLEGVPVTVTSTGIGGPSACIAIEELHSCGAHTMMRIGSAASTSPKGQGVTITKDSYYTEAEPETKPVYEELKYKWESYIKGGATNTSMECAVLFLVGASLGIRTASVMISATDFGQYSNDAKDYPSGWEQRAIEVGIEGMRRMIRKDKADGMSM